ncbi:DHH family phosphoesterase [Candidatus Saccharibacteria bacterium]|nr:DHH family phosphoesterase [Candidatus Saccharibacteria bacterium]
MYQNFTKFLENKSHICIIQAENPDGDSLGSALALDYLLKDKEISLYCPVDIPKYLRYMEDWSRVEDEFDYKADGYIIVDTAASVLLSKLLDDTAIKNCLYSKPVFVFDHHETEDDLDFPHDKIIEPLPACCSLIYKVALDQNMPVDKTCAKYLMAGIMSDTLGLTSQTVTAEIFDQMAGLSRLGAELWQIEESRREFMRKSQKILNYKADLIKRVDYSLDGALATVHIPWEDIEEYSDEYNPGVLIIEELRLVEGVHLAVAIKTYPDGKVTGKLRSDISISDKVAGYFGGGGHPYAAGFRTYDTTYEEVVSELIKILPELLSQENN